MLSGLRWVTSNPKVTQICAFQTKVRCQSQGVCVHSLNEIINILLLYFPKRSGEQILNADDILKNVNFFRATVLHCAVVQVSGSFSQSSSGVLIKRCNEVWTVFQGAVARIQQQPSGHRWREEGVCLIEKNPFVFVLSFHFVLINQRLAGTPLLIYHHPQSDQPYRQPWQPERP